MLEDGCPRETVIGTASLLAVFPEEGQMEGGPAEVVAQVVFSGFVDSSRMDLTRDQDPELDLP